MSEKKRKRGRPRVVPVLSYGSEMKMRNNVARTIKKPRYLRDPDEEDSISRGSTPARSIDNISVHSKGSVNGGRNKNSRGYNPEIDDKNSEYHYGSDFEAEEESDGEKANTGVDSRSFSEPPSDLEDSECDELNLGDTISGPEGVDNLSLNPEASPSFVPFWKLGPAGTLGFRPHTPVPVWLQDRVYPKLELPQSSDDLLMPQPLVLQAVGIYEVLRHFRNIIRLSPFHFEDFCASLLADEQSILLSEIHTSLLKALIREEDNQQTHFGQLDQKDSINIALYFADALTWPETLRCYLQSDSEYLQTLKILDSCCYPYTSLPNRLKVLQFLCDQVLQTSAVREDLLSEGKIRYDDHCRVCHKTGDLLCCDSCSAVYHLDCADPPLSNAPLEIEDWTCSVCNKHKIEGVTDCSTLMENSGIMCRQEPLGYDRHGRKYWFLVRRIIIESEEGDVWYYSTLEQLDLLLLLMDSVDLEEALYVALKEFGDDIRRQMEITERITDKASGSRKADITAQMEQTRKRIEEIQENKANMKKQEEEKLKNIIEEVKTENPDEELAIKTEVKDEETGDEKEEEGKGENKDKEEKMHVDIDMIKEEIKEEEIEEERSDKKETKPDLLKEETLKALIETKREQMQSSNGQLFRLGCDNNFRTYCNQFVVNTLAMNKLQHNEERDKKRHLSHKFSLTNNSEFKWSGQSYGTKEVKIVTVRQTLVSLEQNLSSHFFHPHWQYVRKSWCQYLMGSTQPQQFAKAMLWLVACIKPVVFNAVWHDSLGHIRLKRITALEREERKKQEKKEKKEADDEARLFPFVKFTKGVKHQLWKVKGEEYRIHGLWGWQWLSSSRKVQHIPMSTVGLRGGPDKVTIPIKSNGGMVRGLPINPASYYQLVAKNPSLQFSLLSPKQRREDNDLPVDKKDVPLASAGQFEVSAIDLEEYFEDGRVNVSKELNSRLRLVYPNLCKGSSFLDSLLGRRLALKIQEERDIAKNKRISRETQKEKDIDAPIDVENDSDTTSSDATNPSEEENIDEIPDSQRHIMIHKQRPAGHLLKEMRLHKIKYEALDKVDETMLCYSTLCREGGRCSCYSPSCILKERTKQKLINSVNNYKIITCKPAPFDNVGSCSPIRLSDPEKPGVFGEKSSSDGPPSSLESTPTSKVGTPSSGTTINGQVIPTPPGFSLETAADSASKGRLGHANSDMKLPYDDDSNSQSSIPATPDHKLQKVERIYSAVSCAGKIHLKKSSVESKKAKKHKIPPAHFFLMRHTPCKSEPQPKKSASDEEDKKREEEDNSRLVHSLFSLPAWELRTLARKGGKYSPGGFNQSAKINHHFWPYPCPRPVFRLTWLYRSTLINTVNSAALQLRILWACLRWDDMHEKGPMDGRKQITTDMEIIQTEILKRKVFGRFHEKTEYLRRKVTIPLDMPKPVREFTPSQRSGLRKRRRAQSPVSKPLESTEEWVEEEKLDLWEVRYFGERLEKATLLSKKAGEKDTSNSSTGVFPAISRSTSPSELKAKMEEQVKIQRATYHQKKSLEAQSNTNNKGIVKVAIGNTIPSVAAAPKITLSSTKLVPGASSIVTMGGKLPSVLSGRKIVTTKGGKIITVQAALPGLAAAAAAAAAANDRMDGPTKITLGKSSVFPVTSLPKVQVTSQGNKVIKLQNITGIGGQRTILPRVAATGITTSAASGILHPVTSTAPVSTAQIIQTSGAAASTFGAAIRSPASSQQIQIMQTADGQLQVKGLQQGQQLLQRTDGKLQIINKMPLPSLSAAGQATPIHVTQQTKPKDSPIRGLAPTSGSHILKINGQQVILRTSGANGKQIMGVNAKDAALAGAPILGGTLTTPPKFKMVKAPMLANSGVAGLLKEKKPLFASTAEDKKSPGALSPCTPPSSPSKTAGGSADTMTLRVQVRMTEQGPKTIIQGLQPGVGLTKDHIMAIQQQVRSMLDHCNLQVNQLSPLMTLTLSNNKGNQQQATRTILTQNQGLKLVQSSDPVGQLSPVGNLANETKESLMLNDKVDPDTPKSSDLLGLKDLSSETKENSQTKFVINNDYIQQSVKTALSKNDLSPQVEEKLMQLQRYTSNKAKDSIFSDEATSPIGKGAKRLRDQDENEWDQDVTAARSKPKKAKSEKTKGKKEPVIGSAGAASPLNTKSQIQDARKKLARQQKLEGLLAKHKDLLKKDILKKRALLEKELKLMIHKELSIAKQHILNAEKINKPLEPPPQTSMKKSKNDSSSSSMSHNAVASTHSTREPTAKAHRRGGDGSSGVTTTGSSSGSKGANKSASTSTSKNKKGSKSKSKKIVCICRTAFDDTKFYIGCDLCGNWFHGDCVGISEALSRSMTEYVCDDCANAKLNKDLFCSCKQPYDETQFYICCEKCDDWYHGRCIGIMQGEADDIDDYICPKCDPDNVWNRPCQKKLTSKDYAELKKVTKVLVQHKNAWPFLEPVDHSEVPDYYKVVKVPMDLKMVEKKVAKHEYKSLYEFVGDVMLVFDNCRAYNPPNSSFCSCANTLELFFCMKLKQLKAKVAQRT